MAEVPSPLLGYIGVVEVALERAIARQHSCYRADVAGIMVVLNELQCRLQRLRDTAEGDSSRLERWWCLQTSRVTDNNCDPLDVFEEALNLITKKDEYVNHDARTSSRESDAKLGKAYGLLSQLMRNLGKALPADENTVAHGVQASGSATDTSRPGILKDHSVTVLSGHKTQGRKRLTLHTQFFNHCTVSEDRSGSQDSLYGTIFARLGDRDSPQSARLEFLSPRSLRTTAVLSRIP
jgi:hypothetical protein